MLGLITLVILNDGTCTAPDIVDSGLTANVSAGRVVYVVDSGWAGMVVTNPPGARTTNPLDPRLATWFPAKVTTDPPTVNVCVQTTASDDREQP